MSTPFFDESARNLFNEIFAESLAEFRQEKAQTSVAPPVETVQDPPETSPMAFPDGAFFSHPAWVRLHRAMYVLDMHKGRPHAVKQAFQRRWLEEVVQSSVLLLAAIPEEDTT